MEDRKPQVDMLPAAEGIDPVPLARQRKPQDTECEARFSMMELMAMRSRLGDRISVLRRAVCDLEEEVLQLGDVLMSRAEPVGDTHGPPVPWLENVDVMSRMAHDLVKGLPGDGSRQLRDLVLERVETRCTADPGRLRTLIAEALHSAVAQMGGGTREAMAIMRLTRVYGDFVPSTSGVAGDENGSPATRNGG